MSVEYKVFVHVERHNGAADMFLMGDQIVVASCESSNVAALIVRQLKSEAIEAKRAILGARAVCSSCGGRLRNIDGRARCDGCGREAS